MNIFGVIFTVVTGLMLFRMSLRNAFLPLIIGASYMTRGQVLELGPLNFPVLRILIVIGFVRVMVRREHLAGGLNTLDRWVLAWAAWMFVAGFFHTTDGVVLRLGIIWTDLGCYFLFRIFIRSLDDLSRVFRMICYVLAPISVAMIAEKTFGRNWFAFLGGVTPEAAFRHGKFRAMGPFAHAILAGSVGATCFPMALLQWRSSKLAAFVGLFSSLGIVYASGASGPVMMVVTIALGLFLWRWRNYLRLFRWLALLGVVAADLIMKDPVYYLLARIDITGGSTGWHRAELIHSSILHLSEWWLVGTDRTRHWMPTGIHANSYHTDITNFYLQMGVWGGLLLIALYIANFHVAFDTVGKALQRHAKAPQAQQFLIWTVGALLFGHVVNFFSISYFDQSVAFLYLALAFVGVLFPSVSQPKSQSTPQPSTA